MKFIWHQVLFLAVLVNFIVNFDASGQSSLRKIINLDGVWSIVEGDTIQPPATYPDSIIVPGLVNLAKPAFLNPGSVPAIRQAFWYKRYFNLSDPLTGNAILKVGQALYGMKVYLNGKLAGEKYSGYTPSFFNVDSLIRSGSNELIIAVFTFPFFTLHPVPVGSDYEKKYYIPGICDDVELILSGNPYIRNIQVVPDIVSQTVTVHSIIDGPTGSVVNFTLSEASSGKILSGTSSPVSNNDSTLEAVATLPVPGCHLWTPEDPFLYIFTVTTAGDSTSTRFGMRSFTLDPQTGRAMLNGFPYFMRGSNVTINRFYEDSLCSDLPWNRNWVRMLHQKFRNMHWNSLRYCIGPPPAFWYDIADETGILIENEYPIWNANSVPQDFDIPSLIKDYTCWMQNLWNHPSVVIWDACNETYSPELSQVVKTVRSLDYSNRPWDQGYYPPQRNTDESEQHTYHFSDPNFRLSGLSDADSTAGWSPGKPTVIVNEYGWLWVNRNGIPTTLTRTLYHNLLGNSETPQNCFHTCAVLTAAETEFWRSKRQVAAVMHFCGLDYSRSEGQTSDNWIDLKNLTWEPEFYKYVRDAFAPVGLSIDFWNDKIIPGSKVTIPVIIYNDQMKSWHGPVTLTLKSDSTVISEQVKSCNVDSLGRTRLTFDMTMPVGKGNYTIQAVLTGADDSLPVNCYRDIEVIDAAIFGIAYLKPDSASSTYPGYPASNLNDGNFGTRWSSQFSDPQWIYIDLGNFYRIDSVKLYWETAYGRDFEIQTSVDGTNWITIKKVTGNNQMTNVLTGLNGIGKYIRLYGTARGTMWGYSLYEFLVFGSQVSVPASNGNITASIYSWQQNVNIVLFEPAEGIVEIFDLGGRLVAFQKIFGGLTSLYLKTTGIYLVRLSVNGKRIIKKVIIP